MRPILLQGHTRSLTMVRYNRDGDLIFSSSKDNTPTAWYAHNGERLGNYHGHTGAVWCLDVSADSRILLTGGADSTARLWDVQTGKQLFTFPHKTSVRAVGFALGDKKIFTVSDARMGNIAQLQIFDISGEYSTEPISIADISGSKITAAAWGPLNKYIYAGHEDGEISTWDWEAGEKIDSVKEHKGQIMDLQFSADKSHFITASKDFNAKLWDTESLKVMKTFKTSANVNSAALSSLRDHVIVGGGQEAMQVTTTAARAGKFEVRFFHLVYEEEIGRVKGHFGPINTVHFSPDGKSFASGGEDGYVRVHHFDQDYFEFEMDVAK